MKTAAINQRFFSNSLNLRVPTTWRELTDKQLIYFAFLSATYEPELAKAFFLLRLCQLHPREAIGGNRFLCRYKGRDVIVHTSELAYSLNQLSFLDNQLAVRPEKMRNYHAVNALLQDNLTFFEYLRTDTFFQMYLRTEKEQYIVRMANFLYRTDSGEYADFKSLTVTEQAVVLLWWVGAKNELAKNFPKYFKPAASVPDTDAPNSLMEANDAQIRALTGGDVTKEKEVLAMQCWRCFAELNAKAREAEELKKLNNQRK